VKREGRSSADTETQTVPDAVVERELASLAQKEREKFGSDAAFAAAVLHAQSTDLPKKEITWI
jgi:hypothetical protein